MRKRKFSRVLSALAAAGFLYASASADSEAPNLAHVATDNSGRCFVHSIPDDRYGTDGRTDIYVVDKGLKLQHSYPWFAQQIYVLCNASDGAGTIAPALVQLGPWPRGQRPDEETLAIAFHYNGETLASYSTLDIANGDPKNASCSVSHYMVIDEIEGFDGLSGLGETKFALTTVDGRRLVFDAVTGALAKTEEDVQAESRGECFID